MKVLLFFDQIQSGYGGQERPDVPLGLDRGGVGSYGMFERFIKEADAQVVATLHCGDGFFKDHEEQVIDKVVGIVEKTKVDAIICGPCFHYGDYAMMSAKISEAVNARTEAKAITVCARQCTEAIETYKDKVPMVKMPRKGETGLNEALRNMVFVAKDLVEGKSVEDVEEFLY